MRIGTLALVVALSAASSALADIPGDLQAAIRDRLKGELKDPYSAVVEVSRGPRHDIFNIAEGVDRPGAAVCLTVNAKNSYGAYVGASPYIFVFWDTGGSGFMRAGDRYSLLTDALADECGKPADAAQSAGNPTETSPKPAL